MKNGTILIAIRCYFINLPFCVMLMQYYFNLTDQNSFATILTTVLNDVLIADDKCLRLIKASCNALKRPSADKDLRKLYPAILCGYAAVIKPG